MIKAFICEIIILYLALNLISTEFFFPQSSFQHSHFHENHSHSYSHSHGNLLFIFIPIGIPRDSHSYGESHSMHISSFSRLSRHFVNVRLHYHQIYGNRDSRTTLYTVTKKIKYIHTPRAIKVPTNFCSCLRQILTD